MNTNYSTGYQPPLVPIYRPMPSQGSSSNHQVKKPTTRSLNLDDECSICSDTFRNKVEEDSRPFRMIADTECNHFFHDFCLNEWLKQAKNHDCPECRHVIIRDKTKKINLDYVEPRQNSQTYVQPQQTTNPVASTLADDDYGVADEEAPEEDDAATIMYKAASAASDVLSGVGSIFKWTGNAAMDLLKAGADNIAKANAAQKAREEQVARDNADLRREEGFIVARANAELKRAEGTKVASVLKNWERVSKDVKKTLISNNEAVSVLLATVNSIPASKTNATLSAVERIERNIKIYEGNMKEIHKQFIALLSAETKHLSSI